MQLFRGVGAETSNDQPVGEASWADLHARCRVVWTSSGEPVRQISPRSRLPVGRYNSRKAGRMLHHQSRGHGKVGGEKLALMICEIKPEVADFRSQHIRLDLLINGKVQAYFPDIAMLLHDGTIAVVEVKKDARWQSDLEYRAKLNAAESVCDELGWDFQVWTDSSMAPSTRVRENIAQIQMQRFLAIDDVQALIASRALRLSSGILTVKEIGHALGNLAGAGDFARGLMCRGVLSLPLDERIGPNTMATAFSPCAAPDVRHAA